MKKWIENIKKDYCYYEQGCMFSEEKPNFFKYLLECFRERRAISKCKRKGHDWEEYSDIGPESGSQNMTCKCCGESHSIVFY